MHSGNHIPWNSLSLSLSLSHTHTHTHTLTNMHVHTHTHMNFERFYKTLKTNPWIQEIIFHLANATLGLNRER